MNDIEKAEQQFVGFMEGFSTGSITALAKAMGLTKREWSQIKKNGFPTLPERFLRELDGYFDEQK